MGDSDVSDKKKWLETAFAKKEPTGKVPLEPVSRELAAERAKWLQEQSNKKPEKKENNEPVSRELAAEKAKWIQEQAFKKEEVKKEVAPVSRELAAERAKWLQEQSNKQPEKKENSKAPVSKMKINEKLKWLQGASSNDEENEEPSPVKNQIKNLQGVRPKSVTKSAVQLKKEAFEREQAEIAKKNNPSSFMQVRWKPKGAPGQFRRSAKDLRGPVPKKTLADLP